MTNDECTMMEGFIRPWSFYIYPEGLFQIRDQIIHILDANREAHTPIADAKRDALG